MSLDSLLANLRVASLMRFLEDSVFKSRIFHSSKKHKPVGAGELGKEDTVLLRLCEWEERLFLITEIATMYMADKEETMNPFHFKELSRAIIAVRQLFWAVIRLNHPDVKLISVLAKTNNGHVILVDKTEEENDNLDWLFDWLREHKKDVQ